MHWISWNYQPEAIISPATGLLVFDTNENDMYLSLFRDFDNIVRVDVETFDFINFGNFYIEELLIQDADGDGSLESGEQIMIVPFVTVDFNSYGVSGEISTVDQDVIFMNSNHI